MLLVFERVAQRRQISARQLAHRIHRSTITVHVLSSMRRAPCQFVTAWCHLERDLNWESPWIVSNRPACAFDDACLVWQSKCTDNARHEGKRRRQETAIARFQKCIPKSNIEGQQCKDRGSSALAPVLSTQAEYVSQHHHVADIRHPSISTSEWAVCPRRSKRLLCPRPEPGAA
jgi:hypothetical protein